MLRKSRPRFFARKTRFNTFAMQREDAVNKTNEEIESLPRKVEGLHESVLHRVSGNRGVRGFLEGE
jgi:hypothetical protein